MEILNRVEREIVINAPLDRVWELVSEPGWWIGNGDRSSQTRRREGELEIVDDPRRGSFAVRTVTNDPKRYVAFGCTQRFPAEPLRTGNSTLVEFWLVEQGDSTLVRVVESGFTTLTLFEAVPHGMFETDGDDWRRELSLLAKKAEPLKI